MRPLVDCMWDPGDCGKKPNPSRKGVPIMNDLPINMQQRAPGRGGWIPMFSGESQGRAVERAIRDINANGYRVVFIIEDNPSLLWKLVQLTIAICTLGFYWRTSGVLIIGERMEN